jgi:hypothetical protein
MRGESHEVSGPARSEWALEAGRRQTNPSSPLAPITRLTILEEHRQTAPERSVSFRLPVAPPQCHPQPLHASAMRHPVWPPEIEVPIPPRDFEGPAANASGRCESPSRERGEPTRKIDRNRNVSARQANDQSAAQAPLDLPARPEGGAGRRQQLPVIEVDRKT